MSSDVAWAIVARVAKEPEVWLPEQEKVVAKAICRALLDLRDHKADA